MDGNTPPPGFRFDQEGRVAPNINMVNALTASIRQVNTAAQSILPPMPTTNNPPVPPTVTTNALSAGQLFGRQGTRMRPSDASTIATVTINGRRHDDPVYDINGNPIL